MARWSLVVFSLFVVAVSAQSSYNCTAGEDCVSQQTCTGEVVECPLGSYCPGNTTGFLQLCPPKFYCPTPATIEKCPKGYVCRTGTIEPKKCEGVALCSEGALKERRLIYLIIEIIIAIGIISYVIYRRCKASRGRPRSASMHLPSWGPRSSQADIELQLQGSDEKPKEPNESSGAQDPEDKDQHFGEFSASHRFDIRFDNLGLTIETKDGRRKKILSGVTGEFKSGNISAILGPTGSGKTTLVNILRAKLKKTSGKIWINEQVESVDRLKKVVGYVPQDNTMLTNLTVREVLDHSARLRLPASYSLVQKKRVVTEVIKLLRLDDVENSVIGDTERRGISGGERKRVNIGLELVAQPDILFLDEPTTGLDSTNAKEIMNFLRKIASRGITVIAVLHQPRYEVVEMCDTLLLLAKGGRTVYSGAAKDALDYFAEIGFPCPRHFNPADHYLDVMSGGIMPNKPIEVEMEEELILKRTASSVSIGIGKKALESSRFNPTALVVLWQKRVDAERESRKDKEKEKPKKRQPIFAAISQRETTGFFQQIFWYIFRSMIQQARDLKGLSLEIMYQVVPGAAMGVRSISKELFMPPIPLELVAACPAIIRDRCMNEPVLSNALPVSAFFLTMTFGCAASVAANRTFSEEKDVYYREASAGVNKLSYFLAKNLWDLCNIARNCYIAVSLFMFLADAPGSYAQWFGTVYCLMFAAYGVGYFVSNFFPPSSAIVVCVTLGVAFSIQSGLSPTLTELENYQPLGWLWYLSYNRWASESIYLNGMQDWDREGDPFRIDTAIKFSGYERGNYGLDLGMMILLGILWRIAAFVALVFKNRGKQ